MSELEEYKAIIANNLAEYRKQLGLTQSELAEKLSYSDKSISKWERGGGVPDLLTMKKLADFFKIAIDDFFLEEPKKTKRMPSLKKRILIPTLSAGLVLLVAIIVFSLVSIFMRSVSNQWLAFIYMIPITGIVTTVFSAIYRNKFALWLSESVIIWGVGLSLFLTGILFTKIHNLWLIFIICVPIELLFTLFDILKSDSKFMMKFMKRKNGK